jgi:hypothetical protein
VEAQQSSNILNALAIATRPKRAGKNPATITQNIATIRYYVGLGDQSTRPLQAIRWRLNSIVSIDGHANTASQKIAGG